MRVIKSAILLLVTIIFCFQQWAIIVAFDCNRTFIAEKLCVQRKVKHNCCQGKCYLKKSLQKNTENPTSDNKSQLKLTVETLAEKETALAFTRVFKIINNDLLPQGKHFHAQQFIAAIFHPPSFA